jgi:hypothetical protein
VKAHAHFREIGLLVVDEYVGARALERATEVQLQFRIVAFLDVAMPSMGTV